MTTSELREATAKLLGWWEETSNEGPRFWCAPTPERWVYAIDPAPKNGLPLWRPDEDANQAALLLAEVSKRRCEVKFARALAAILGVSEQEHFGMLVWAIANATPLQKTQAVAEALEKKQ